VRRRFSSQNALLRFPGPLSEKRRRYRYRAAGLLRRVRTEDRTGDRATRAGKGRVGHPGVQRASHPNRAPRFFEREAVALSERDHHGLVQRRRRNMNACSEIRHEQKLCNHVPVVGQRGDEAGAMRSSHSTARTSEPSANASCCQEAACTLRASIHASISAGSIRTNLPSLQNGVRRS
jgi:hypothetical protein